jgi:hypothetical protein
MRNLALVLALIPWLAGIPACATELKPETVAAFNRYVTLTEAQMEETARGDRFFIFDRFPKLQSRQIYDQLQQGQIYIEQLHTLEDHQPIRVPSGMIHHWAGVIFIPKATLAEVLAVLNDYDHEPEIYKPEIRRARLIEQNGNVSKVYQQLYTKSIVTVVLNGYFEVTEIPLGSMRSASATRSTRIVEVANAGGPDEHEIPEDDGHGYMWRMNSYWRIEGKDGGVYVQNESISLTRSVPVMLAWLINPLTQSIPRDVLTHMLTDTQKAVLKARTDPKPETVFQEGPNRTSAIHASENLSHAFRP